MTDDLLRPRRCGRRRQLHLDCVRSGSGERQLYQPNSPYPHGKRKQDRIYRKSIDRSLLVVGCLPLVSIEGSSCTSRELEHSPNRVISRTVLAEVFLFFFDTEMKKKYSKNNLYMYYFPAISHVCVESSHALFTKCLCAGFLRLLRQTRRWPRRHKLKIFTLISKKQLQGVWSLYWPLLTIVYIPFHALYADNDMMTVCVANFKREMLEILFSCFSFQLLIAAESREVYPEAAVLI